MKTKTINISVRLQHTGAVLHGLQTARIGKLTNCQSGDRLNIMSWGTAESKSVRIKKSIVNKCITVAIIDGEKIVIDEADGQWTYFQPEKLTQIAMDVGYHSWKELIADFPPPFIGSIVSWSNT